MNITIYDKEYDNVINSVYSTGKTTFEFAVKVLVPMINKYQEQRYILKSKLYTKLEDDLKKGCIMPPITIAIKNDDISNVSSMNIEQIKDFVNENISSGYVLDGIQRLSTLKRIHEDNLTVTTPIYLNILISDSTDKMLYRMITLNNGQKPMSARHQIEILADSIYDFNTLGVSILTEKEQKTLKKCEIEGLSFTKENIIKAYLAYVSRSINIDNQKIISEKLDELVTSKILESDIPNIKIDFSQVFEIIKQKCIEDEDVYKWFSVPNNMIGFCSGIAASFQLISLEDTENFKISIEIFESSFKNMNSSKINVGTARRKACNAFIENYIKWKEYSEEDMIDQISIII